MNVFTLDLPHGIRLECRGRQDRPQALLLHGFPEAAFAWDEVIDRLDGRVRCAAPNLRGFGGSSAPAGVEHYRAKHLVADVVAAIEALGAPLPLLVAHDWGGALAWNLAALRPDLVRRLLILNSPHPGAFLRELQSSAEQQRASAYMNFLCRPDAATLLAADGFRRLRGFLTGAAWMTPELERAYLATWERNLDAQLNWYRASPLRPPAAADDPLHALQLPDAMLRVRVPTTVLWGEQDTALRPGLLDGLESWVPALRIVRVPDASHWIVHEKPALVAETIAGLVAEAEAPSPHA